MAELHDSAAYAAALHKALGDILAQAKQHANTTDHSIAISADVSMKVTCFTSERKDTQTNGSHSAPTTPIARKPMNHSISRFEISRTETKTKYVYNRPVQSQREHERGRSPTRTPASTPRGRSRTRSPYMIKHPRRHHDRRRCRSPHTRK